MPSTALFSAPFLGFFLGRGVSLLGSAMAPAALALAVLGVSGRAGDLGIVLAAQLVPQLAFLLLGGAVADRFSRRAVLVIANLGSGITQAAVALLLISGHYRLGLVAALEFANGVLDAFTTPALRGIVPELVAPAQLRKANSLLASTKNASRIFGPTAAGLLVSSVGGGWAIGVDALSFLVAAGFFARLRLETPVPAVSGFSVFGDIRVGWLAFRRIRWVWWGTLAFCVVNLVNTGTWQILGPELTQRRSGAASWGLVLSARAVGLLVMSVLMYRLALRHPLRAGQIAGAGGALALLGLGLGFSTPLFMLCTFFSGMGFTLCGISWDTALQQRVPRELLSRISSYTDLFSYAAIPVGQLLVGPAASSFGASRLVLCCAAVFAVAMLAPLCVRSLRELRSVD